MEEKDDQISPYPRTSGQKAENDRARNRAASSQSWPFGTQHRKNFGWHTLTGFKAGLVILPYL